MAAECVLCVFHGIVCINISGAPTAPLRHRTFKTRMCAPALSATTYRQKGIEGNYIPPMPGLLTEKWKCKQTV